MYSEDYIIYADVLFLINFSVDFLCLFISGRLNARAFHAIRLIGAAAVGGLYSFVPYLLPNLRVYITFPMHILAALLICCIAYKFSDAKGLLLLTLAFIASAALIGGLVTGIHSLVGDYADGVYSEVSALSLTLACIVSAAVALIYGLACRRRINVRSVRARIFFNGIYSDVSLLVDSGNLVTEPFSALPVILLSHSALPPPYDLPNPQDYPVPMRAIPFKTSSGHGCIYGFRAEGVELSRINRKRRVDAFIGVDPENASFSGFDGILPASLL